LSNDKILEKLPAFTFVGKLSTEDKDTHDRHTYTLTSNGTATNNGKFLIRGDSLLSKEVFYASSASTYLIHIKTEDSSSAYFEEDFTIYVLKDSVNTGLPGNSSPSSIINIFPNPFHDFITFRRSTTIGTVGLKVFDAKGDLILIGAITGPTKQIDLRKLSSGMYFLQLEINGRSYVEKIIKQ
jgi:hypothetical protein